MIDHEYHTNLAMIRGPHMVPNFSITSSCIESSQELFTSLCNCFFTYLSKIYVIYFLRITLVILFLIKDNLF